MIIIQVAYASEKTQKIVCMASIFRFQPAASYIAFRIFCFLFFLFMSLFLWFVSFLKYLDIRTV